MTFRIERLIALLLIALTSGCTHVQLRNNTIRQAETLSDIYTQQVLDNLAMFVRNPDSLPFFAHPTSGTTDVNDSGTGLFGLTWNQTRFSGANLGLNASRTMKDQWQLQPITDPHKLILMRCAYQIAVSHCGYGAGQSGVCPDCEEAFEEFEGHDAEGISRQCLRDGPHCWFQVCCEKHLPKHCQLVGHYCGTSVWVCPEGVGELTRLTLAILDYAIHEPPQPVEKVVTFSFDKDGNRTKTVKATLPVYELDESLLAEPESARRERAAELRKLEEQIAETRSQGLEPAVWKKERVDRLRRELEEDTGLRQKFLPSRRTQTSDGVFRSFQNLSNRLLQ